MSKNFLLWVILVASPFVYSNQRKCTLLPITDSVNGAIGIKVFQEVESYLKSNAGCEYTSPAGLLSIFSKYRDKLEGYLTNQEVLKTVAEKLQVGSIIRVHLENQVDTVVAKMDVIGADGSELLFSEKVLVPKPEPVLISESIKSWIDLYVREIPYDGLVVSVLGDQITINLGKNQGTKIGQKFTIKKMRGKKTHPLLKKVVEWDADVIAEGRIFNVSENQALGVIKIYRSKDKLAANDWILLDKIQIDEVIENAEFDQNKEKAGNLGIVTGSILIGNGATNTSSANGTNQASGMMYGFNINGEAWITRNWIGILELGKELGTQSKSGGNLTQESIDVSTTTFKMMGGYKFLPLGFFYGPQVDFYAGYASYLYSTTNSPQDGLGDLAFKGIAIGSKVNIPLTKDYRFMGRAEAIPLFGQVTDADHVHGGANSMSSMQFEIGGSYTYNALININCGILMTSNTAKFEGSNSSFSYRQTSLKMGLSYTF